MKNVEKNKSLLYCVTFSHQGISSPDAIDTLAAEVVNQDLLGIMVWFNSVEGGLAYDTSWDTSGDTASQDAYIRALQTITA